MTAQPKLISTTEYAIEKNVPVPVGHGNSRYPFAQMQIGDSVVIPSKARTAAYTWAKSHQRQFLIRPEGSDTIRVWRAA